MRHYLAIFILLFASQSFANVQKIAAVVNDDPITMQEFLARKKMVMLFNKIGHLNAEQEKGFNKAVLDGLIEEQIIVQQGQKLGIKVADEEVLGAIEGIEERNKMRKGQLIAQMSGNGVDPATFRSKIRTEILKNKVISGSLASGLSVSPSEVDAAVLDSNSKDAAVTMKVMTAKDDSEKVYNKMVALSKKLPDSCDKLKAKTYKDVADVEEVSAKLSQLDPQVQSVVKDMVAGDHTEVIKVGGSLKLFMVCSKKIENLTPDETNYIVNFLGNKKLFLKSQKYMEDLRKRAYVKILM